MENLGKILMQTDSLCVYAGLSLFENLSGRFYYTTVIHNLLELQQGKNNHKYENIMSMSQKRNVSLTFFYSAWHYSILLSAKDQIFIYE